MQFKSLLFLFMLLLGSQAAVAQLKSFNPIPFHHKQVALPTQENGIEFRMAMDSLLPPAFDDECFIEGGLVVFFLNDDWGTVSGMNGFLDLEKAQRFDFTGSSNFSVSEAWGFFSSASVVNDGEFDFRIYAAVPEGGGPGTLLGSSKKLKVSEIMLDEELALPTIFTFDAPVPVNQKQFFVSANFADLYTSLDTVSLLQTNDDCGDGADSWELFGDGKTWAAIRESWELNADWFIAVIVEFDDPVSVDDPFVINRGLTLYPAFPNPASEEIQLSYELANSSPVTIELYTATGQLIKRMNEGTLSSGQHQRTIQTGQLTSGAFVYSIVTNDGRLMSRFIVD